MNPPSSKPGSDAAGAADTQAAPARAGQAPAALTPLSHPPVSHPPAPLAQRRAALDPKSLQDTAQRAARALLRQGEASNTRLSYSSAMRYWCAWYAARYGAALTLPVPVPVVIQFIVDHAARRPDEGSEEPGQNAGDAEVAGQSAELGDSSPTHAKETKRRTRRTATAALVTQLPPEVDAALVAGGYKGKLGAPSLNTLVHRIAVLSKAHQLAPMGPVGASANDAGISAAAQDPGRSGRAAQRPSERVNPCADPLVRELLARTRRAYAQRGAAPKRQRALTKDPLQLLLATCDESLAGKRDRALLLFAWATGGRRRSEVASATLENLQRVDGDAFVYTLTHSKTNQRGDLRPEDVKPLVGSAAAAMRHWLAVLHAHGVREGAIFRRIRRGGHLAEPLAAAAVRDIVKSRCTLAGIEGRFSAHSLRAGFVTEAGKQNLPLAETMALTGHQSVASVVGYFRAENSLKSKASRMLDEA
ncbi:site-specific integrase [Variovorax sp. OV329]|uniref:site-specific integrase n=1 Tax=Variovorax sp. OV329 TaxID=1882825 RepID=UPI0008E1781E|nr:site-specific integrase [Variovorax sp. OV329]SFN51981.1 Phage integrase family protein [Variovorax sp. OV329]